MLSEMPADTELELLITVVVAAVDDEAARTACQGLLTRVDGRVVESCDCSDEEPGCWSVTIGRDRREDGPQTGSAALSRAVRNLLRELGPSFARHRVACAPPTAWAVVDDPELMGEYVSGGERLMVEAWEGDPVTGGFDANADDDSSDETGPEPDSTPADTDDDGNPRPRLRMSVDVVTERMPGAEWPARALASRLSRTTTIIDCQERPPLVRVSMDLGPTEEAAGDVVRRAVSILGGNGWSRMRVLEDTATARWSAAPTPPSGIAGIELTAETPSPGGERNACDDKSLP